MSRGDGTYWYDDDRKRWVGQIYLTRTDGSTFRPKRIGKTRAEVRDRLRKLQEEHDIGIDVGDTTTVGELAEWWLREVAPSRPGRHGRPISEATLIKDGVMVNNHIVGFLGHHRLRDLTPEHVETMLRYKVDVEGLGHDWVTRLRARLVEIIRHAERRDRIGRNVAAIAIVPRRAREVTRRRAMTPDEARRLMDAAKGHRLEALVMVGMMLGLRPAELRGLVWSDIDFERGTLRVAGVEKDGRRIDEVKMSHEKAKRTLVMPDAVHEALVEHRQRWGLERSVADSWTAEDFVFVSTAGTPLNRNNLLRTLRTFSAEAGIGDDWNVYELRHTAASLLYNAGVPKERIADVLGHADTRMLDRVYLHPTRDALAHAASPMNDLFGR